jgi:hypothetical protein
LFRCGSVAPAEADPIIAWLDRHFEADVFSDIRIEPGERFLNKIESELDSVEAFAAVIGPGWLDAKDDAGNSRLDDPETSFGSRSRPRSDATS